MNPENKPFQNVVQAQNQPQGFVFDKYIAIALVVGIIVGFLIGRGSVVSENGNPFFFGGNSTSTKESDLKNGLPLKSSETTNKNILVSNQSAGNHVVVSKLSLDKTYWVAVRDNAESTMIPYVLGARKLVAGEYSDLSIFVSRNTKPGEKYDVVLYKDSVDFNYDVSAIVMDGDEMVRATFQAE